MKYKGNYLPFIIISLVLYGLFFYKNSESVSTPKDNINDQANVQLNEQIRVMSSANATQPITQIESEAEMALLTKKIAEQQTKLETEKQIKTRQAREAAKQLHRQNIEQNEAASDALLKEHIFNLQLLVFQQKVIEEAQEKREEKARQQQIAKQLKSVQTDEVEGTSSIASMLPISSSSTQVEASNDVQSNKVKITPKVDLKKSNSSTVSAPIDLPKKTTLTPNTTTPSKQSATPKIKRIFKPKPTSDIPSSDAPAVITPDEIAPAVTTGQED